MERKLTPIDIVRNSQVAVDFKLPGYIQPNKIGMNVERVLDVVETIGVNALHISGDWTGKPTVFTLGMGVEGTVPQRITHHFPMMSGQIERAYAPRIYINGEAISGFSLTVMAANIDLAGIPERIIKEGILWQQGVRTEQAWAYHISKKLQWKLFQLAFTHLLWKVPEDTVFSKSLSPLVRPFSLPWVANQIFVGPLIEAI